MTGLPRKYAKMGFKRGWAAFRGKKRKTTKSYIKTGGSMAKRRKTRSHSYKKARVSHRKSGILGGLGGGVGKMLGAGLYGAGREYLSNAIAPVTSQIPLGNVSDEVGMIAALWAGKKFLGRKVPMVNDIANAGMLIEASRIGATFATGGFNMAGSGSGAGFKVIG